MRLAYRAAVSTGNPIIISNRIRQITRDFEIPEEQVRQIVGADGKESES